LLAQVLALRKDLQGLAHKKDGLSAAR